MMNRPENLHEWATYISSMSGEPLFSQTVAANSQTFSQALLKENFSMWEVEQIMLLFVRQLRATGTKVPDGGPWDLNMMALTDPVAKQGQTMTVEESQLLELQHEPAVTDDFDIFELEAAADL